MNNNIKARYPRAYVVPTQYEVADMPSLGWVTITDAGDENIYFTLADGSLGFIKVG